MIQHPLLIPRFDLSRHEIKIYNKLQQKLSCTKSFAKVVSNRALTTTFGKQKIFTNWAHFLRVCDKNVYETVSHTSCQNCQILNSVVRPKCGSYNTQQCKNLYFGHWLLNRAKITTADIKNIMNPLWEPLQIPSGHSLTDMIRAIRWHCQKIHQYGLLIQAYRRRKEYKTNVWDTEEKRFKYVDTQAENLAIPFTSTLGFWLFFFAVTQSTLLCNAVFLFPYLCHQ